jgi:HB1, ASXL, restriction endonuclease HTH domain
MTLKEAVETAMRAKRKPMTVSQIAEVAVPLAELKGKTPKQQVYSLLFSENKKPDGIVSRTAPGTFKLNPSVGRRRDGADLHRDPGRRPSRGDGREHRGRHRGS